MTSFHGYELLADYHTHTIHSHGTGTVAENARAAAAAGLSEVAVTDHGPALAAGMGLREPGAVEHVRRMVEQANLDQDQVRVLQGVEANVMDRGGALDLPDKVLRRMDIVLAGFHPASRGTVTGELRALWRSHVVPRLSWRLAARQRVENTKSLSECAYRHAVDILVHPGLRVAIDPLELARAAAKAGTALEINSAHGHLTPASARAAARTGCFFAINSDAHSPVKVGDLAAGARIASLARIAPERILNTGLAGRSGAVPLPGRHGRRTQRPS
ncbi:MAG: PHP domain-containing protein [Bacillota bacterium]|nr:PHP domain-containing protein [Bacillota bacterium]